MVVLIIGSGIVVLAIGIVDVVLSVVVGTVVLEVSIKDVVVLVEFEESFAEVIVIELLGSDALDTCRKYVTPTHIITTKAKIGINSNLDTIRATPFA